MLQDNLRCPSGGVPWLMRAYREGYVALANSPGAGIADDGVVYAYVPLSMIPWLKRICCPGKKL